MHHLSAQPSARRTQTTKINENKMLDRRFSVAPLMDWTDRHCRASHRLMRCRALYTEMVASAALVGLNRSDLCRGDRSCSIISVPGSAVTKRASGVPSGIFVHEPR